MMMMMMVVVVVVGCHWGVWKCKYGKWSRNVGGSIHRWRNYYNAIVRPRLKKPHLDAIDLSSYRPISNLSFVSKIFERIIDSRFTEHADLSNLLSPYQSAYRKFHSTAWTETVLVKVHNDIDHYGHWSRRYWSSRHARLNISIRHRRPSDHSRRPLPALRCQRSSTRLVSFLPVQSLIYSSPEFWSVGDGCCRLRRSTRLIVGPKDVYCIHRRDGQNLRPARRQSSLFRRWHTGVHTRFSITGVCSSEPAE